MNPWLKDMASTVRLRFSDANSALVRETYVALVIGSQETCQYGEKDGCRL